MKIQVNNFVWSGVWIYDMVSIIIFNLITEFQSWKRSEKLVNKIESLLFSLYTKWCQGPEMS